MSKNSDKGGFTQEEIDNMLAGKPIKEDKPDLAKLARLCGLEVIEVGTSGRPAVSDGLEPHGFWTFDPFGPAKEFYPCRSREVLRQAVIEKAGELGFKLDQNYYAEGLMLHRGNLLSENCERKMFLYHDRPEAEAWAEALFWLIGQEQAK